MMGLGSKQNVVDGPFPLNIIHLMALVETKDAIGMATLLVVLIMIYFGDFPLIWMAYQGRFLRARVDVGVGFMPGLVLPLWISCIDMVNCSKAL